jgi:hypothetical protein
LDEELQGERLQELETYLRNNHGPMDGIEYCKLVVSDERKMHSRTAFLDVARTLGDALGRAATHSEPMPALPSFPESETPDARDRAIPRRYGFRVPEGRVGAKPVDDPVAGGERGRIVSFNVFAVGRGTTPLTTAALEALFNQTPELKNLDLDHHSSDWPSSSRTREPPTVSAMVP